MPYHATVRGERFAFADLRELFAKANEEKSGDQLAGIAAANERERVAAKLALADVTLGEIVDHPLIDPDADDVSRLICDALDRATFDARLAASTGEFMRARTLVARAQQALRTTEELRTASQISLTACRRTREALRHP